MQTSVNFASVINCTAGCVETHENVLCDNTVQAEKANTHHLENRVL